MNLRDLLRKIANSIQNVSIYVDTLYKVERAYFDDDDCLTIETYHKDKLTVFVVDAVEIDKVDEMIWISGGGESFTIEFIKE